MSRSPFGRINCCGQTVPRSLAYIVNGECVLRYDNERGKGDHRHFGTQELRYAFSTPELLWQVLTAKRWELLKAMCGAGPMSIREAARRVGRDIKAVHGDVTVLLNAGVLNRLPEGKIEFPFDAIKVEFMLQAA